MLKEIPAQTKVSIERETFPLLLKNNHKLYAYPNNAYWLDLGTPQKYLQAHRDVANGKFCAPDSIQGSRYSGIQVKGFASVGQNVQFGTGCLVEDSVILNDVIIGNNVTITGSIVGNGVVLGDNVELKAGTVLGDFERRQE
jgi:mannose-1-phosphate guanylyltransferase